MIEIIEIERHDPKHGGYRDNIIQATVFDNNIKKLITFYRDLKKKSQWGTEVYSGYNYIVGSTARSHSRNYVRWKGLPKKYKEIAEKLKKIHKKTYG